MSENSTESHVEENTIVVNKLTGDGESSDVSNNQNGGEQKEPLSAESKSKLDAMDLMDATEFGLAPNPEQSGGNSPSVNRYKDGKLVKPVDNNNDMNGGGSKVQVKSENKVSSTANVDDNGDSDMMGGGDDDDMARSEDPIVVYTDGDTHLTSHTASKKTKKARSKSGRRGSNSTNKPRYTTVDVALPMGGKAVVPFAMPKNLNMSIIKRKFDEKYRAMKAMKPEAMRRKIAELEAIIFENPSANDLANGLLDIIDDKALKCMAMKSVLADGL